MNRRSFLRGIAAVGAVPFVLKASAVFAAVPKQTIYGRVFNAPVHVVNPYDLIYRVSDGPVSEIGPVYDGGIGLVMDGDVGTYDELMRGTVLPGHAMTCAALGYIRFGAALWLAVTADVVGADHLRSRLMCEHELCGAADRGRLRRYGLLIEQAAARSGAELVDVAVRVTVMPGASVR